MLVVLHRAWVREEIERILKDEQLDDEEKFEAITALDEGRQRGESIIHAAKAGALTLALQPALRL